MMENKSDKGGFWKRQSFLLPPLTAAVVLLCQQMASSNPSGVVTVNILLLVLNFFSYVGLLRGEKSTEKSVAIAAASFITLMAFVFNTCVAGIPTPLSDMGIFMNSLCGMWVLVAVVQGSSLLIQAVLQPTVEQETGASATNVWNRLQKAVGRLKPKAEDSQEMILTLLRLATVLLAIVSWWSTAQGMRDYVFSQAWQANLASFAIQSILLGLNFYLPTFWRWIHSLRGKICVLALSGVVLFCSSWFSYVFIVGTVYEKSWQTESRLLVQSVYRNELYKADEFVQISSDALRETLGDEVAALYTASKTADTETTQNPSGLDLTADKASYADNADFAANSEIASAIQAMQTATQEGTSSGVREQAAAALTQLTKQVETRIEQLTQQISQAQDALTAATDAQTSAASALRYAPYGSNTNAYYADDGKLLFEQCSNAGADSQYADGFYVLESDKEPSPWTLTYSLYDKDTACAVVAAKDADTYLVEAGVQDTAAVQADDGASKYVSTGERRYALISKADYWSGNANYRDFEKIG